MMSQATPANQTEREFWATEGPQQYVQHGRRYHHRGRRPGSGDLDLKAILAVVSGRTSSVGSALA